MRGYSGAVVAMVAMVPLGIAVAVGYRTRLAAAAYLGTFVYCELMDAALYLNHYWYVTLACSWCCPSAGSGRSTRGLAASRPE